MLRRPGSTARPVVECLIRCGDLTAFDKAQFKIKRFSGNRIRNRHCRKEIKAINYKETVLFVSGGRPSARPLALRFGDRPTCFCQKGQKLFAHRKRHFGWR